MAILQSSAFVLPSEQQRALSMCNLASAVTSSPAMPTREMNCPSLRGVGPAAVGYSAHWTAATAQYLPMGYGQCFPQAALPLQTPTTRCYPSSSFPTPPHTPSSAGSLSRFPFPPPPPPPSYNVALATAPAPSIDNTGLRQTYGQILLPPVALNLSAIKIPSPTPSPTPSPGSQGTATAGSVVATTDTVSHSLFESYLHETWPQDSVRRGSSTIRSPLYDKIASVLQGGDANGREKQWIKKSEFFLVEREGRGLLLAVPVVKSRPGKRGLSPGGSGGGKSETRGPSSYRLVARLEDFYYIISCYHNNNTGHHGIRRTYGMVSRYIGTRYIYSM